MKFRKVILEDDLGNYYIVINEEKRKEFDSFVLRINKY